MYVQYIYVGVGTVRELLRGETCIDANVYKCIHCNCDVCALCDGGGRACGATATTTIIIRKKP